LGFGDDIITTSVVKRAFQKINAPVCVGDGNRSHYNEVFRNNPKIAPVPYKGVQWVHSYKGNRPYIERIEKDRWVYKPDFRAEPGEIYLSDDEKRFGPSVGPFILIEPDTKTAAFSKNKNWGRERWQRVVNALPQYKFLRMRVTGVGLNNVDDVPTTGIRDGFSMVHRCRLFVGTDGALHHAAAALGRPAVVVWGGLASPVNLGYSTHINLHAGSPPCGSLMPCVHCTFELEKITVEMVCEAIVKAIDGART